MAEGSHANGFALLLLLTLPPSSAIATCTSLWSKAGDSCGDGKFCVPSTAQTSLTCVSARLIHVTYYRHGFSCGNAVSWAPSASVVAKLTNLSKRYDDDASDLATAAVRDPALADLGVSDSAAAQCPPADFVASSSMRRAMQTAHLMFPNHVVHIVPSIGEMDDERDTDPQVGFTSEELAMPQSDQIRYLCKDPSQCWANFSFCSLPAAPAAPVSAEATQIRQAVANVKELLGGHESAAAWLNDTDPSAPRGCGNRWPVAANMTHFSRVLLPKIVSAVPLPLAGATAATLIAVVTHSTTMKRSLQPLVEMDHWPESNEGVQLRYVIQPTGEVTELTCGLLTCHNRIVSCGVPYRKHKTPWPCSGVKSCGAEKAWRREAIACAGTLGT